VKRKSQKVVVIGDVILDEYVYCKRRGLSAETPTIVVEKERTETFVGGAGLVVRNLLRLGDEVTLFTIADRSLKNLFFNSSDRIDELEGLRLASYFVVYPDCPQDWTITKKTRFFAEGYKMFQVDELNKGTWNDDLVKSFLKNLDNHLSANAADAIVMCDNRHGMFSEDVVKGIIQLSHQYSILTFVDSQISAMNGSNHDMYSGVDLMLMNENELEKAFSKHRIAINVSRDYKAKRLAEQFHSDIVLKLGSEGVKTFSCDSRSHTSRGFKVDVKDTCGAGDAFLAALVHSGDLTFANKWAALSTTYVGTVVPKNEDLRKVKR